MNLFEKIRSRDFAPLHSDRPWVVVVPHLRVAHTAHRRGVAEKHGTCRRQTYLLCHDLRGASETPGNTLNGSFRKKNMRYMGCAAVTMPENYIAMFSVPDRSEAMEIIARAEHAIDHAANTLRKGEAFPSPPIIWTDRISSSIVNSFFYPVCVHAKRFYATDACVFLRAMHFMSAYGKYTYQNGKPVWGNTARIVWRASAAVRGGD